jgi:hypothetical protein
MQVALVVEAVGVHVWLLHLCMGAGVVMCLGVEVAGTRVSCMVAQVVST